MNNDEQKELTGRNQMAMITLDDSAPQKHLVRKTDASINFNFICNLVSELYSKLGKPSIDTVVLIKICMIQYLFGIRSMRKTTEEIQTNTAYRWFIGYDFTEPIPHFSTFCKNYVRRFEGTKLLI